MTITQITVKCPHCHLADYIKVSSQEKNTAGYKCTSCQIFFIIQTVLQQVPR